MAEVSALAFKWTGDCLMLLDQRKLPHEEVWVSCKTAEEVAKAISDMVTRGAPLIGITAAFGMVLAAQQAKRKGAECEVRSADERVSMLSELEQSGSSSDFSETNRCQPELGCEEDDGSRSKNFSPATRRICRSL
jgi:methylthioribose-1-phosphate isomerase